LACRIHGCGRGERQSSTRDAPRPKTVAGAQWHRQFLGLNITIISHAHSQGCDHWNLGSGQDEPPWPGAHNQLAVYPSLALMPITIQYVSGHFSTGFRSTIGTDFITKTLPHHSKPDELVTLQIWNRPRPPPGLLSPLPPIAHATVRTLPGKNDSRPFLPRFSAAERHPDILMLERNTTYVA
jgi:hypothetical protein